jgi:hypothetical protein
MLEGFYCISKHTFCGDTNIITSLKTKPCQRTCADGVLYLSMIFISVKLVGIVASVLLLATT